MSYATLMPDPSLELTLRGHRQTINAIAYSNDGKQVVTGSDDNTVMLWSLSDRLSICYRLLGHTSSVLSVAFTPQYILSSSTDCSVRLWRLNTIRGDCGHKESIVYRCHTSSIRCVDANESSTHFCTASDDKTIKIWSANATNKFIASLSGVHTNWVRSAVYSKLNDHLIGSCGDDGLVCVWDTRNREAVMKLCSKRKSCHYLSVAWHPNCEHILSASSGDSSIRIWDLRQEKLIQYYAAHDSSVNSVNFHSSGNYLISSSNDNTCKIFDLLEGRNLFTINANQGFVKSAVFSDDGQYFATAGQSRQLLIWKSNLICAFDDENGIIGSNDHNSSGHSSKHSNQSNHTLTKKAEETAPKIMLKSSLRRDSSYNDTHLTRSAQIGDNYNGIDMKDSSYSDNNNNNGVNEGGDHLSYINMYDVSQNIVTQLKNLTDSVVLIEQRLSNLEKKFESHCTANTSESE